MSGLIPLRPYQLDGVDRLRQRTLAGVLRVLFVLATGGGKCLALGTKVLRFDGRAVAVEDVAIGDLLMGPDSEPRRVLGTTRGHGPLRRVVPTKGDPWVCNDVHVLTLVHSVTGAVVDIDIPAYLAETKTFRHVHKQFTPPLGVDFPLSGTLPIDPYFVGAWFGDGTKSLAGVAISKPDPEILQLAEETAAAWGLHVRTDYSGEHRCPTHHIVGHRSGGLPTNRLLTALRALVGDAKSIPHAYLTAARDDRAKLLAGLLDTDGHLGHVGYDIVQKERGIADGVCFVARSLGLRATLGPKVVDGVTYWRISISGDLAWLPMRIPRKRSPERRQKKCATRTGVHVEDAGVGDWAGFELDGDGRFLLGDFTVTHNTIVASHIVSNALECGSRVLFCAHRRELIAQSFCKLVRNGIPIDEIGIIMGDTPPARGGDLFPTDVLGLTDEELWTRYGRRRPGAKVQVASIDSLRGRTKPLADLVIIDEAHRALSKSYVDLVAGYPDAVVLGLTATPYRADGKPMAELFDELVVIATPRLLIDEGFLVEPTIWRPGKSRPALDMSKVKMRGGDYEAASLAAACDRVELVGDIVEHWQMRAAGVRTVAFATSVEHSKSIAARFVAAGVPAEHLDGETPTPDRAAILARLARGETLVVSNCMVLTEGWDMPCVKCAILACPTKSAGKYLQQAGRILRPFEGQPAIILDHAGCSLEHGFPSDDREFTLAGDSRKAANAGARARSCPQCGFVVPLGTPQCNGCGYIFQPSDAGGVAEVIETAERLVLANASQDERDRELFAAIVVDWEKRNAKRAFPLKPGWIFHRFREKTHGRRPPRGCELPKLDDAQLVALERAKELKATAEERNYSPAWVHVQASREPAPAPAVEAPAVPPPAAPRAPWDRKRGPLKPPTPKKYTPEELEEVTL